ncbi:hypothetical protein QJS66_09230 [Kocuria rhizophila]|nr:hypothetical protein QJS66_09230 [Kocuria rhizophila]
MAYSFAVAGLGTATAANTAPRSGRSSATVIAAGMAPRWAAGLHRAGPEHVTPAERENGTPCSPAPFLRGSHPVGGGGPAGDPARMAGGAATKR